MRQCLANQQWDTDLPRCVPANNKGGSDGETKAAPRPKMNPETRSMKKVCKAGFQNDARVKWECGSNQGWGETTGEDKLRIGGEIEGER